VTKERLEWVLGVLDGRAASPDQKRTACREAKAEIERLMARVDKLEEEVRDAFSDGYACGANNASVG